MANTDIAAADLHAAREERPEGFWDGVTHAYIPTPELRVPEGLRLHRDAASEIDPITYEVIRHGLWNANAEHVRVIETSGAWSHVVIPDQPSQKDARGYPGWVPSVQLTSRAPGTGATVRIAVPTLNVGGTDLAFLVGGTAGLAGTAMAARRLQLRRPGVPSVPRLAIVKNRPSA